MTLKLAVFDMGNTLLNFHAGKHTDDEKDLLGSVNMKKYLKKHHDLSVTSEQIKTGLIDKWYGDFYIREQLVELDVCLYVDAFLREIGYTNENIDCKALMKTFYMPYIEEVIVNEGALEALKSASESLKVGVISNCILFDSFYELAFDRVGLSKYIDKYIFSYSRQIRKPNQSLFREMLNHFGLEASEALMIGDSYKADIKPASELGMKTVHYSKSELPNSLATWTVSDLSQLTQIIASER